jgi:hypothetical protein
VTQLPTLAVSTGNFTRTFKDLSSTSSEIATGDLNNDGDLDIITSTSIALNLHINDGSGNFSASYPDLTLTGGAAWGLALGDIDGDGNIDIVASKTGIGDLDLFQGNGDGTFGSFPGIAGVTGGGAGVKLGDINNDGFLDIITNAYSNMYVLIGDGTGSFTQAGGSPKALGVANTANLSLADLNNDGYLDVVMAGGTGSSLVLVLLNNQNNTFANAVQYPTGSDGYRVITGDYNNDGNIDIAVANLSSSNITVLEGIGDGTFTAFSGSPYAVGGLPILIMMVIQISLTPIIISADLVSCCLLLPPLPQRIS